MAKVVTPTVLKVEFTVKEYKISTFASISTSDINVDNPVTTKFPPTLRFFQFQVHRQQLVPVVIEFDCVVLEKVTTPVATKLTNLSYPSLQKIHCQDPTQGSFHLLLIK